MAKPKKHNYVGVIYAERKDNKDWFAGTSYKLAPAWETLPLAATKTGVPVRKQPFTHNIVLLVNFCPLTFFLTPSSKAKAKITVEYFTQQSFLNT